MGRSKELFEYLRQHGMYTGEDPGDEVAEAEQAASRATEPARDDSGESETGKSTRMTNARSGAHVESEPGRPEDVIARQFAESRSRQRRADASAQPAAADDAETPDDQSASERPSRKKRRSRSAVADASGLSEGRSKAASKRRRKRRRTEGAAGRTGDEQRTETGARSPNRGRERTRDKLQGDGGGTGDRTVTLTYNNAVLIVLFLCCVSVLTYFLGFTQGIGPVSQYPTMSRTAGGADRGSTGLDEEDLAPATDPSERRAVGQPHDSAFLDEQAATGTFRDDPAGSTGDDSATTGAAKGVLEGKRLYYSIAAYAAGSGRRDMAEWHTRSLQRMGYDAWLHSNSRGYHVVWVGRFDDRDPELEDLLAALRVQELQSQTSKKTERPYAGAYISQITASPR